MSVGPVMPQLLILSSFCFKACLVTLFFHFRVYLLYHTWSQVLYGGVAGSIMAIAWFAFTQEILTPLFPRIAAW